MKFRRLHTNKVCPCKSAYYDTYMCGELPMELWISGYTWRYLQVVDSTWTYFWVWGILAILCMWRYLRLPLNESRLFEIKILSKCHSLVWLHRTISPNPEPPRPHACYYSTPQRANNLYFQNVLSFAKDNPTCHTDQLPDSTCAFPLSNVAC